MKRDVRSNQKLISLAAPKSPVLPPIYPPIGWAGVYKHLFIPPAGGYLVADLELCCVQRLLFQSYNCSFNSSLRYITRHVGRRGTPIVQALRSVRALWRLDYARVIEFGASVWVSACVAGWFVLLSLSLYGDYVFVLTLRQHTRGS
jgi:hypothetical protein